MSALVIFKEIISITIVLLAENKNFNFIKAKFSFDPMIAPMLHHKHSFVLDTCIIIWNVL